MNYKKLPIKIITEYLWDQFNKDYLAAKTANPKNEGETDAAYETRIAGICIWSPHRYPDFTPFFPVSETQAASTDVTPFVIYDFLYAPSSNTQWFINCEKAVLTIIGEMSQIYFVRSFIHEALKKFDVSAQEINDFAQDSDIKFKFIKSEQTNYILDEKRIDSFKPKFVTSLVLTYDYTKV